MCLEKKAIFGLLSIGKNDILYWVFDLRSVKPMRDDLEEQETYPGIILDGITKCSILAIEMISASLIQ